MKTFLRVLTLIALTAIPFSTMAAVTMTSGKVKYELNKSAKTAKVIGHTSESWESLKIKETIEKDGVTYKVTAIDKEAFYGGFLTGVTIPSTVKTIGTRAFKNNLFKSVTLPEKLEIIGVSAFEDAFDKYTDLVIPKNVRIIRKEAFKGSYVKSVKFAGKKIEEIGDYAFCGNAITEMTIPAVDVLGEGVMCGNTKLTKCVIKGSIQELGAQFFNNCPLLSSVTVPSTVIKIGYSCFGENNALTDIPAMPNLQEIGRSAFYKCKFKTITLPSRLTIIGQEAFNHCDNLTEVTIPASVKVIGDYAFDYSKNIRKVTVLGGSPVINNGGLSTLPTFPDLGVCGFDTDTYFNGELHIPAGMFESYDHHREWQCFRHIIDPSLPAGVDDITSVTAQPGDVYDLQGRHILHLDDASVMPEGLPSGIYLIRSGEKTRKVKF